MNFKHKKMFKMNAVAASVALACFSTFIKCTIMCGYGHEKETKNINSDSGKDNLRFMFQFRPDCTKKCFTGMVPLVKWINTWQIGAEIHLQLPNLRPSGAWQLKMTFPKDCPLTELDVSMASRMNTNRQLASLKYALSNVFNG